MTLVCGLPLVLERARRDKVQICQVDPNDVLGNWQPFMNVAMASHVFDIRKAFDMSNSSRTAQMMGVHMSRACLNRWSVRGARY